MAVKETQKTAAAAWLAKYKALDELRTRFGVKTPCQDWPPDQGLAPVAAAAINRAIAEEGEAWRTYVRIATPRH